MSIVRWRKGDVVEAEGLQGRASLWLQQVFVRKERRTVCQHCCRHIPVQMSVFADTPHGHTSLYLCSSDFCDSVCEEQALREGGQWLFFATSGAEAPLRRTFLQYLLRQDLVDSERFLLLFAAKCLAMLLSLSLTQLDVLLEPAGAADPARIHELVRFALKEQIATFLETFGFDLASETRANQDCEDLPEAVEESFSMLVAMLAYEQFPPFHLYANIDKVAGTLIDSPSLKQAYGLALQHELTLSLWQTLLKLLDQNMLLVCDESSYLQTLKQIPTMKTYSERWGAMETLCSESTVDQAVRYLEGDYAKSAVLIAGNDTTSSERADCDVEAMVAKERMMVRVAQAASLANTNKRFHFELGCNGVRGIQEIANPFDGFGFIAFVLCTPPLQLAEQGGRHGLFKHSCVANIHADFTVSQTAPVGSSALQLHFIANRDIYADDELRMNFDANQTMTAANGLLSGYGNYVCGQHRHWYSEGQTHTCDCDWCYFVFRCGRKDVAQLVEHILGTPSEGEELEFLAKKTCRRVDTVSDVIAKLPLIYDANLKEVSAEEFSNLRRLRAVADHLMQQPFSRGNSHSAQSLYAIIISHSLGQVCRDHNVNTFIQSDADCANSAFVAEICLSLGIIGFDQLSENETVVSRSTVWSVDVIFSLFNLGNQLDKTNKQLRDIVEKGSFYHSLRANSSASDAPLRNSDPKPDFVSLYRNIADRQYVCRTSTALLTADECQRLIDAAEGTALLQPDGWSTNRHYAVPTTDVALHQLDARYNETKRWFVEDILLERLKPLLCRQFFGEDAALRWREMEMVVNDIFIVKYSAGSEIVAANLPSSIAVPNEVNGAGVERKTQRYLPLHADQSSHSLTIALNSTEEYLGGGTFFPVLQDVNNSGGLCNGGVVRPQQGEVSSFSGSLLHGGHPILCGHRFIIAAFLVLLPPIREQAASEQEKITVSDESNASPTIAQLCVEKSTSDSTDKAGFSFSFF